MPGAGGFAGGHAGMTGMGGGMGGAGGGFPTLGMMGAGGPVDLSRPVALPADWDDRHGGEAEMYGLLMAAEALEKIRTRDGGSGFGDGEYDRLRKEMVETFDRLVSAHGLHGETFIRDHDLAVPNAKQLLLVRRPQAAAGNEMAIMLELGAAIVTFTDALMVGDRKKEDLLPPLKEIVAKLGGLPSLPPELEPVRRIRGWMEVINALPSASSTITEEQKGDLELTMRTSYDEIKNFVARPGAYGGRPGGF